MRPAHVIEIVTPKKYHLNGLWFGPKKARQAVIFIHGLTGSAFSMDKLVSALVDSSTAVLTFNNRGYEQIGEVKRKRGGKSEWVRAGAAHEVFVECIDDIDGAVRTARRLGVKEIFLAGHSTGAQKSVYWAASGGRGIAGIILLGPLSDYSGALAHKGAAALKRNVAYAKKLVKTGKRHELMPSHLGEWFVCDAQRYISLYSGNSAEDIFTYAQPSKAPKTLKKVRMPILTVLAGADEHGDMSAKKIGDWFAEHLKIGDEIVVVPKVGHSFKGAEKKVANLVRKFMRT